MFWEPIYVQYGDLCRLGQQVARLFERLPRERVKVVLLEDVAKDPSPAYRSILKFLASGTLRRSRGDRGVARVSERCDDEGLFPVQSGMPKMCSQDLATKYYDKGSFAVFPSSRVLNTEGAGTATDFVDYVLPSMRAIDIDTEEDWRFAEILFARASRLNAG
jgi:hypothetical protein